MSKFYGTVRGDASQTDGTRRGFHSIKVAAQSWDGSLITRMHYGHDDALMVELCTSDDSSTYGQRLFYGTFQELKDKLMDKPGAFERRLIEETQKKVRINEEYERTLFEAYEATSIMLALQEDGKLTADEMLSRVRELDKKLGKIWG